MIKRIGLTFGLCILVAATASAGWKIDYRTWNNVFLDTEKGSPEESPPNKPDAPGPTGVGSFILEKYQFKVNMGTKDDHFFILDVGKQNFIFAPIEAPASPAKEEGKGGKAKSDTKPASTPPAAVVGTEDDLISVMDDWMAMLNSFMSMMPKPPPEVQKEIDKQQQARKPTKIETKALTGGKTIAGCATKGYQVLIDGKPTSEIRVCPEIDLTYLLPKLGDISRKFADHAAQWFKDMPGSMQNPMKDVDISGNNDILAQIKGYPFLIEDIDENGRHQSTFEVTKYKKLDVPASEFQLPKGYTAVPIKDYMNNALGGMMGMMGGGPPGNG